MTTRRPPIAPIDLRRAARLALGLSAVWSCGCPTAPPLREVDPDVVVDDAPGADAPAIDRPDAQSTPDAPDATAPDATAPDAKPDDVLDAAVTDDVFDGADDTLDATPPDVAALDALPPDAPVADRVTPMDVATCPGATCAGRCVDTQTDVAHCGACGRACAAGASCVAGACACPAGLTVCDGRCVNTANDGANCGGCGTTCLAPRACTSGRCAAVCGLGQTACSGSCVNTQTDVANCGACGRACAAPAHGAARCAAGACGISCDTGYADCDGSAGNGCEVDLRADVASCGSCGRACSVPNASPRCAAGVCAPNVCAAGYGDCDGNPSNGCEADLTSDVARCGSCGRACAFPHGGAACIASTCRLPGCLAGWGDCDGNPENGCERAIVDDVNNCGGCNIACNLRSAVSVCRGLTCAVSSCLLQYRDCNGIAADGCETNSFTDRANCGACGIACPTSPHSTPTCELGACGRACDPGYGDCNGSAADGCEASLSTLSNCGECGRSCPYYPHTEPACGIECEWRCEDCWLNNDGVIDNGCERQIC